MAETVADQENFTYIPLSSFVILLVIILTCASRRKKIDAFNAIEQNTDEDFRKDYAVMCFPCLRKKPDIKDVEPTTDLADQFEYIVEKYTIRKVPLLLANTTEDILERQEEIGLEQVQQNQPQVVKDDFLNLQMAQEVYNVQKTPPCLTVAPNTSCPGKRALRERSRPTDVLESMSPIPRPMIRNPNYVVIPTKGSLRHKDIMITKREITNQYLNNFSSVFVDNLKDQVPKDPERFPSLSRPYTSAIKDLPLAENLLKPSIQKKSKKRKYQKVAYTFPAEEIDEKREQDEEEDDEVDEDDDYKEMADEGEMEEEEYEIEEEGDISQIRGDERYYYSDSGSKDQIPEVSSRHDEGSEYQEDAENDARNFTDKSKLFVLLNDSDNAKEASDIAANPFKITIQSSPPETDRGRVSPSCTTFAESFTRSFFLKDDWPNPRTATYEDIQSLDVGYEFTSREKLGVKPKMTRIPYPHENDRLKDAYKQLALGDNKISKRCFIPQEPQSGGVKPKSPRTAVISKPIYRALDCTTHVNPSYAPQTEKSSSKSSFTETSFLSKPDLMNPEGVKPQMSICSNPNQTRESSTTTITIQSDESKSYEMVNDNNAVESIEDTVTEISKMYDLPGTLNQSRTTCTNNNPDPDEHMIRLPAPSKSRSSHDLGRAALRKESTPEAKGLNSQDSSKKIDKGRVNTVRPKSERYRPVSSAKQSETSSTNLIQRNLDNYLLSLKNFELKEKLDSCRGNLGDCPLLNDFREGLKKSISSHIGLTPKNDSRLCKTSRIANTSRKEKTGNADKDNLKMNNSEKKQSIKDVKMTPNISKGVIRSTRAQDLRSQSNRDLLKPKTTVEKTRTTSPYLTALPQKKKKCSGTGNTDSRTVTRSIPGSSAEDKKKGGKTISKNDKITKLPFKERLTKEKSSSAGDVISLQRQRTQEIINPKIVKKTSSNQSNPETAAGDFTPPQLKKSQTFFICKGAKTGEGDIIPKEDEMDSNAFPPKNEALSDGNCSDDEIMSPKPKPLTHNDSFCLIVKSSQNWSQKNRSDDQKWLQYGLAYESKKKKTNDKGILKNSNCDLKSVDSLEKIESEKIVRFSDELLRNKKALKKLVRRKKRIQNFLSPNWYQRHKLFQKYLQILKEKSVLLSDGHDTPDDLKPFQVPIRVKEIYEAEMFGLHRKGKFMKNQTKVAYSY